MAKLVKHLLVTSIALVALGMLLCVISIVAGVDYKGVYWGNHSRGEVESMNEIFHESINSLQISVSSGTLELKRGKNLQLVGEDIPKGTLHYSLENGILKIEDESRKNSGLHFSLFGIGTDNFNMDKKITLYLPEEVSLDALDFEMAAGTSRLEDITTKTAKIEMDAGELEAKNVTVSNQADISMDAGQMTWNKASLKDSKLEVNAGKCTIDGTLYGETRATVNAGKMKLQTDLKESEYAFSTDATAGNIKINGKSHHKEETDHDVTSHAENAMSLECNAGTIKVETE